MLEKKQVFNSLASIVLFMALFGFVSLGLFVIIDQEWRQARGYEYEWIAGSLASGHGFSFDRSSAWLGPYASAFVPTAWVEPVQVIIITFSFRMMGENGRLFLVLLNIFWLSLTGFTIFRIGKRLQGRLTGFISVFSFLIVLFINAHLVIYIGNMAIASFLISLSALALINLLDGFSVRRVIILGIILGLTNLTHASSLLFTFLAACTILIHGGNLKAAAIKNVGILLVTVLITLSPWIIRNYIVFNRIIPIRNGFGWQLYLGNLGLSALAGYDLGEGYTGPGFSSHALSARQAVVFFKSFRNERKVRNYLETITSSQYPEEYSSYNEAQRDRFFLHKSLAFLQAHPLQSMIFMFWKSFTFFTWDKLTLLLTTLAFGGWLVRFKDIRVHSLMLLTIAYSLPYILSIPLYYRYCFPIQPLMAISAAISIRSILCLTMAGRNFDKSVDSISSGAVNIL